MFNILKKAEEYLFLAVIFFIPTQLGKHFWPDFAYVYSLKIDYLSPTIYFWDLLIVGLFLVWIFQRPKVNLTAILIFEIFLLSQALSLINASNIGAFFVRLEQYLMVGILFIYIASKKLDGVKENLWKGLFGAIFIQGVLALGQFLKGGTLGFWILGERSFSLATPLIATFNFQGQVYLRPYGTFPHPNVLGAFMVLSIPLMDFLKPKARYNFLIQSLGIVITVLTFSRAVLIVLFLEAFLFLRKKLTILLIGFLFLLPILFVRFESAFNFDNLSLIRRSELNGISLIQFLNNPIFGVGVNNFINNTATSSLVSGPSRFLQPVHNIYLLILAETGLVGFIGFLSLILYCLFRAWKKRRESFFKLIFYLILIILFLGLFDHYFLTLSQGQRLLFLILGLSLMKD